MATRTGVHAWEPEQRTMIVEFSGGKLDEIKEPSELTPMIEICGDAAAKLKVKFSNVQKMEGNRWRLGFLLAPAADEGKLADVGPVEMRCCLKKGEDFITETWIYRIQP